MESNRLINSINIKRIDMLSEDECISYEYSDSLSYTIMIYKSEIIQTKYDNGMIHQQEEQPVFEKAINCPTEVAARDYMINHKYNYSDDISLWKRKKRTCTKYGYIIKCKNEGW